MPYEIPLIPRRQADRSSRRRFPKEQDTAVERSRYETFWARQTAALVRGRYIGIGRQRRRRYRPGHPRAPPSAQPMARSRYSAPPTKAKAIFTALQIVADQVGCRIEDIVATIGDTGAFLAPVVCQPQRLTPDRLRKFQDCGAQDRRAGCAGAWRGGKRVHLEIARRSRALATCPS